MMEEYVDISLKIDKVYELRVPLYIRVKELLLIIKAAYNLQADFTNSIIRDLQDGKVYSSFERLERLHNAAILIVENFIEDKADESN
jgi:hypothetical protein